MHAPVPLHGRQRGDHAQTRGRDVPFLRPRRLPHERVHHGLQMRGDLRGAYPAQQLALIGVLEGVLCGG